MSCEALEKIERFTIWLNQSLSSCRSNPEHGGIRKWCVHKSCFIYVPIEHVVHDLINVDKFFKCRVAKKLSQLKISKKIKIFEIEQIFYIEYLLHVIGLVIFINENLSAKIWIFIVWSFVFSVVLFVYEISKNSKIFIAGKRFNRFSGS